MADKTWTAAFTINLRTTLISVSLYGVRPPNNPNAIVTWYYTTVGTRSFWTSSRSEIWKRGGVFHNVPRKKLELWKTEPGISYIRTTSNVPVYATCSSTRLSPPPGKMISSYSLVYNSTAVGARQFGFHAQKSYVPVFRVPAPATFTTFRVTRDDYYFSPLKLLFFQCFFRVSYLFMPREAHHTLTVYRSAATDGCLTTTL